MNAPFQRTLVAIAEERSRDHPADAERALQRGMDRYRRRIHLAYGVLVAAAVLLIGLLFMAHQVAPDPTLEGILISDVRDLPPKAEAQLTATGIYSDDTQGPLSDSVTWTSDDPAIATVDPKTGKLTGKSSGDATITATSDGVRGQIRVTVTEAKLEGIEIHDPGKLEQGKTLSLVAMGKFSDDTTGQLAAATWKSNKPAVAKVDSKTGEVTGVSPGEATITATADGKHDSAKVVVTPAATKTPTGPEKPTLIDIKIAGPGSVTVGKTESYAAIGVYSDHAEKELPAGSVEWRSSDPLQAHIDSTGTVTGGSQGAVTITASQNGVTSKPKHISVEAATTECTPPAIIEGAYIGRPAGEVKAELTALGLQPVLEGQIHEQVEAGTVLKVDSKCVGDVWQITIVQSLGPAETALPTPSPSGP